MYTGSFACLNPGPPLSNACLQWDRSNNVVMYKCPPGYVFSEGGTTRTLGCNNGQWPDLLPVCHGIDISQVLRKLMLHCK